MKKIAKTLKPIKIKPKMNHLFMLLPLERSQMDIHINLVIKIILTLYVKILIRQSTSNLGRLKRKKTPFIASFCLEKQFQ